MSHGSGELVLITRLNEGDNQYKMSLSERWGTAVSWYSPVVRNVVLVDASAIRVHFRTPAELLRDIILQLKNGQQPLSNVSFIPSCGIYIEKNTNIYLVDILGGRVPATMILMKVRRRST